MAESLKRESAISVTLAGEVSPPQPARNQSKAVDETLLFFVLLVTRTDFGPRWCQPLAFFVSQWFNVVFCKVYTLEVPGYLSEYDLNYPGTYPSMT